MRISSLLSILIVCGAPAFADCIDGSRETTEAEKQFYVETLNALKAAVPAAPAGWTLEDRNRVSAPGSVCNGSGKLPIRGTYEVRFYWQDGIKQLDAKNAEYRKRIAELKQLPPDKQKEYDETGRRGRDLERQARKLMATDKAEAEKLLAESKQLTSAAHEIRQSHLKSISAQIDAISQEQFEATNAIKTDIRLRIAVNGFNMNAPEEAKPATVPGATLALAGPSKTVVAFGQWNRQGSHVKPVYTAGATTRVANVALEADGDPEQVKQLLAGWNSAAITSLIQN